MPSSRAFSRALRYAQFPLRKKRILNFFTAQIIDEFRANAGRVGGQFDGARLLLLTTTGARSGKPHTTVLGYYPDLSDRLLVVGSAGGGPKHPDWYHNLLADPRATVETGAFTYEAEAEVLRDAERDETFARLTEADPGWGEYQSKTSRTIPVVALRQLQPTPVNGSSFGEMLRTIHDSYRRELALIRRDLTTSGPSLGAQLRINCLTLCASLHIHHGHESSGLFPTLRARYPELEQTLDQLEAEHTKVATLLETLQSHLSSATPTALLPEIDALIETLLHHLDYEEAQLIPLMDG
jgi:deazaflavin-dependent oxidoreductase (nitroreductase family)